MKVLAFISFLVAAQAVIGSPHPFSRRQRVGHAAAYRNVTGNSPRAVADQPPSRHRCVRRNSTSISSLRHITTLFGSLTLPSPSPAAVETSKVLQPVPSTVGRVTSIINVAPKPISTHRPVTTASASHAPIPATSPVLSGSTSSGDIDAYLSAHNTLRANHGASALTWSDTLAAAAQTWANNCVFEHSGGKLGAFGENLAAGSGDFNIAPALKLWSDEESEYDSSNPQPSHYTQMVWKATTQVGCALNKCDLSTFSSEFWPASFYVCEYSPQGNVIGEFAQNVQ